MRIIRYQSKAPAQMVQVDRWEALRLIESLASQLRENSPNTGRWETNTEVVDANLLQQPMEYFSIAVVEPKKE